MVAVGGRSRIRTYDRSVMSRWLYQLSYAPNLLKNKQRIKYQNKKKVKKNIGKEKSEKFHSAEIFV